MKISKHYHFEIQFTITPLYFKNSISPATPFIFGKHQNPGKLVYWVKSSFSLVELGFHCVPAVCGLCGDTIQGSLPCMNSVDESKSLQTSE